MSILSVFHASSPAQPNKMLTHHDDITATLAEQGVRFTHQPLELRVRPGLSREEALEACRAPLDQCMTAHGCTAFELLNCDGQVPELAELRNEHVYDTDEVFAVISGRGQMSVRLGDYVYAVLCEKGDVLHVPAGTRRWVDLGDQPFCVALRLLRNEGIPEFTGDPCASAFLGMGEF